MRDYITIDETEYRRLAVICWESKHVDNPFVKQESGYTQTSHLLGARAILICLEYEDIDEKTGQQRARFRAYKDLEAILSPVCMNCQWFVPKLNEPWGQRQCKRFPKWELIQQEKTHYCGEFKRKAY